jgi:hypothetical protein
VYAFIYIYIYVYYPSDSDLRWLWAPPCGIRHSKAEMAVILYSGPRTWGGVYACFSKNTKTVVRKTLK